MVTQLTLPPRTALTRPQDAESSLLTAGGEGSRYGEGEGGRGRCDASPYPCEHMVFLQMLDKYGCVHTDTDMSIVHTCVRFHTS